VSKQAQTTQAAPPDTLTDHQYDGIREYDNPTPGWWFLIFALSFIWACGYWIRYELNPTPPTIHAEWEEDVAEANKALFAKLGDLKPDEQTLVSLSGNAEWMPVAASMFRANCVACHGRQGQGDVGPNLTDDSYKNIKLITDIPRVIREGANGQAMPAWRGRLSENEIVLLAGYVASLRGQNLSGRAREGEVAAPWPKPAAPPAESATAPIRQ
jgi:cytochrome c oxidase cbb3-type subunit 3